MPTPITKKCEQLSSLFVRNAIPTEGDYADLIAASLNQAEDGLLKLPNQPLALLAPKQPPEKVNDPIALLNVFADPAAADPSWQLQLTAGDKPGIGLADHRKNTRLFLDGTTGNLEVARNLEVAGNLGVGTGTAAPAQRLTVEGPWNAGKDLANNLENGGQLAIKGDHPQLDFIDTDANQPDWAIHVNEGKLSFIRSPWEDKNLVLDDAGNVGVGTDTPAAKLHVAGSMRLDADLTVNGSIKCDKITTKDRLAKMVKKNNVLTLTSTIWRPIDDMKFAITLTEKASVMVLFKAGGMQLQPEGGRRIWFRMMLVMNDMTESQHDSSSHEFRNSGFEFRDVTLTSLLALEQGSYEIRIDWRTESGVSVTMCGANSDRSLIAFQL